VVSLMINIFRRHKDGPLTFQSHCRASHEDCRHPMPFEGNYFPHHLLDEVQYRY
jgi:hypothetical protein